MSTDDRHEHVEAKESWRQLDESSRGSPPPGGGREAGLFARHGVGDGGREVTLDRSGSGLLVGGRYVALTRAELAIVAALLASPGIGVAREQLLAASSVECANALSRSVDVHVARVRRKLLDAGADGGIATLHGRGYQWVWSGDRAKARTSALGDLRIDVEARRVFCAGRLLPLTSRELDVILLLESRRGAVVTRSELRASLDGGGDPNGRAFDVHISHLRAKIGDFGLRRRVIRTVRGRGWMIAEHG